MNLWVDEDLSPSLVAIARHAGYNATCVRDRGALGRTDRELARVLLDEDFVLVTDNAGDFLTLAEHAGVHPGIILLEQGSASDEAGWLTAAIQHIEAGAGERDESAALFMVNRVIEVDRERRCSEYEWPKPPPGSPPRR